MGDTVQAPSSPPRSPKYPPLTSASLFPPPPASHALFTPLNQHFYATLKEHWPADDIGDDEGVDDAAASSGWTERLLRQRNILLTNASKLDQIPDHVKQLSSLSDDADLLKAIGDISAIDLRLEMDPPDLSVITESAKGYHLFGQWWPIPAVVTGVEEAGIKRLYQDDDSENGPADRRPALQLLLRSLVTSYLKLLSLLQFPPSYYALSTMHNAIQQPGNSDVDLNVNGSGNVGQEEITWLNTSASEWNHLRTIALNIQEVLNRSRKEQAKRNLEQLMVDQIQHKRREIDRLKEMMARVKNTVESLRGDAGDASMGPTSTKIKLEQQDDTNGADVDNATRMDINP